MIFTKLKKIKNLVWVSKVGNPNKNAKTKRRSTGNKQKVSGFKKSKTQKESKPRRKLTKIPKQTFARY